MLDKLITAYRDAQRRLFFLDYDGTLVDFQPTPAEAKPDKRLLSILASLSGDVRNTVIIISGRDRDSLEMWLGALPLGLVAEHGYFVKQPGGEWQASADYDDSWKETVRSVMQADAFVALGSFIEEKATGLAWHYRSVRDQKAAEIMAMQLTDKLRRLAAQYNLIIAPGNKVVEARVGTIDKGVIAGRWLNGKEWDFILAAGDDTTDEDLFSAMPASAFTIRIGSGASRAAGHLPNPQGMVDLLSALEND